MGRFVRVGDRGKSEANGERLSREVRESVAREGVSAPVTAWREPVGSRVRMGREKPCAKCREPILAGSSFRLRRLGLSAGLWACHVSC